MEKITSRKNEYIRTLRALSLDGELRRERREYVCDGRKLLREALSSGEEVTGVLWKNEAFPAELPDGVRQTLADGELFDYVSPLKNSPGPLFTVRMPGEDWDAPLGNALVLENVQDPGNVGTLLRTANAFGIDAVILCGDCADLYHPKTVRSTMGAIFRQRVLTADLGALKALLKKNSLPLYGAALHRDSALITELKLSSAAVAVGSEGQGLSEALLALCERTVFIPILPQSESLNAAVAGSLILWEMVRKESAGHSGQA